MAAAGLPRPAGCRALRRAGIGALLTVACAAAPSAWADDTALLNRGNDPFLQVSAAVRLPGTGRAARQRGRVDARVAPSHRAWQPLLAGGRCRLPNAYQYDKDVADSLQRRLHTLDLQLPAGAAAPCGSR